VYDETPDEETKKFDVVAAALASNAIYPDHIGHADYKATDQVDLTQYRQRGYKVGSLKTGPNDPDLYYKLPAHPLSPNVEKARFKTRKETLTYSEVLNEKLEQEKEKEKKK
jgi:hypothetical protein